jgi:hypothetical protein
LGILHIEDCFELLGREFSTLGETPVRKKLKGRDHLGDLRVDGRIILKGILKKYSVRVWVHLLQDRVE